MPVLEIEIKQFHPQKIKHWTLTTSSGKLLTMARDHFVPRHYLREFGIGERRIHAAKVEPYQFFGAVPIDGQCQKNNFYEQDEQLNKLIWQTEKDTAPVLKHVIQSKSFTTPELIALKYVTSVFAARTRKSVEHAKVLPRFFAESVINAAITRGELPPCPDGPFTGEMMDFQNVPGTLIKHSLRAWLEMHTLGCKLLEASSGTAFITSDSPVIMLNQFCIGAHPLRHFAGYAQAGFQLLFPISPKLCLFFFDPKVYKVGARRERVVPLAAIDVEVLNSFQIQFAERCVYFHEAELEPKLRILVAQNSKFRIAVKDTLSVLPTQNPKKKLIHTRRPVPHLAKNWQFCRIRRHPGVEPGDLRNPEWSGICEDVMHDILENPSGEDLFARFTKAVYRRYPA